MSYSLAFYILISLALSVAQCWIGTDNSNECPIQSGIPSFLLFFGLLGTAQFIAIPIIDYCPNISFLGLVPTFLMRLGLFIYGNVIVFGSYSIYDGSSSVNIVNLNYCRPLVMNFALASLIVQYIFYTLFVIGVYYLVKNYQTEADETQLIQNNEEGRGQYVTVRIVRMVRLVRIVIYQ